VGKRDRADARRVLQDAPYAIHYYTMRERAIYTRARYSGRPRFEGGGRGKEKSGGNPLWSLAQVRAAADRSPRVRTLGPRGLALSPLFFFLLPPPPLISVPSFASAPLRFAAQRFPFFREGSCANASPTFPIRVPLPKRPSSSKCHPPPSETLGISCRATSAFSQRSGLVSRADFNLFRSRLAFYIRRASSVGRKHRHEDTRLRHRNPSVALLEALILPARRSRRPRIGDVSPEHFSSGAGAFISLAVPQSVNLHRLDLHRGYHQMH